ncbi:MAG: coiled-coil domain-containing protein [Bacillota bacterium]
MSEDKILNTILHKIDDLGSKVDNLDNKFNNLDTKVDKLDSRMDKLDSRMDNLDSRMDNLDSRMDNLDSRVDGLEVNLSNFRGEFYEFRDQTNDTLSRIEKRANATFDQVGGLSEYRTKTENQLDNIESDMSYYARKQIENEKEIYKLENKIAK